jgi:hypothetical protein
MNADPDVSDDQTITIDEALDQHAEALEALIERGHTKLVGVLRAVLACKGELQALEGQGGRDFVTSGNIIAKLLLGAVESMIEHLENAHTGDKHAVPHDERFADRARLLAADVIALTTDLNGEWPYHAVQRARHDARRLLIGVDEGPYEGNDN